jgi:DNA topoisomerase VI subunit B
MTTAPELSRAIFTTSRVLEFFTEKELQMQIGHPLPVWPLALAKELIDNALDACETAGLPPEITVTVEPDAVTVQDNGPGLPEFTLRRSLDYLIRVSDKSYYVSPTRGQLGNALKCVWAAPFVADGSHGRVDVETGGTRYQIDVTLDRIAQVPRIAVTTSPSDRSIGTAITMHWPDVAGSLLDPPGRDFYNVVDLVGYFSVFNPHAGFQLVTPGKTWRWGHARSQDGWAKWHPTDPTSPQWYTTERLSQLIAAYLSTGTPKVKTVRELCAEFAGLSGSLKQKAVTDAAGLSGAVLQDLVRDGDIDRAAVALLLTAMQAEARPVKPARLGAIGEEHLRAMLTAAFGTVAESIRYHKAHGEQGGVPFIVETAFGVFAESDSGREVAVGINWSPALQPPMRQLLTLLGGARVDPHDPVALLVHIACPRLDYTDRGKTMLGVLS